jgi:hypothetical protein
MREEILEALCSAPRLVERILRVFPTDRLDDRSGRATFSPREAIASLADNEMIILDRLRLANLKPGSQVSNIDPIERAMQHHYADKNVFHEAEVFESRRQMTCDYLRNLSQEDMAKSFVLSGMEMSIRDYISLMLANDMFHLEQLSCHLATEVATIS